MKEDTDVVIQINEEGIDNFWKEAGNWHDQILTVGRSSRAEETRTGVRYLQKSND